MIRLASSTDWFEVDNNFSGSHLMWSLSQSEHKPNNKQSPTDTSDSNLGLGQIWLHWPNDNNISDHILEKSLNSKHITYNHRCTQFEIPGRGLMRFLPNIGREGI